MQHKKHKYDTSETRATRLQQRDTSATPVRHECDTNEIIATWVKNFDFDNETGENIFSHLYISYMANERLQGEEQFHSKNYLLEMPRFHAEIRVKWCPQN